MDKEELLKHLSTNIYRLENLSIFIERLKSAEPWFQSSVVQDWVAMKIAAQYIREGLIRLQREIS